jgi:hypothetical protein
MGNRLTNTTVAQGEVVVGLLMWANRSASVRHAMYVADTPPSTVSVWPLT